MTDADEARQILRYMHTELTARITGAGHGRDGELPPVMVLVVPDEALHLFADCPDPACMRLLDDLARLGRAENIIVQGGQP
jgi:hypothetical protein